MQKGKDLKLYRKIDSSYEAIASCKNCDISKTADTIEVSSATSGTAKEYIPGRTGWKITCDYLVADTAKPLDGLLLVGTMVELKVTVGSESKTGSAIVTSCDVRGQTGSLMTGSFSFQGSGELV